MSPRAAAQIPAAFAMSKRARSSCLVAASRRGCFTLAAAWVCTILASGVTVAQDVPAVADPTVKDVPAPPGPTVKDAPAPPEPTVQLTLAPATPHPGDIVRVTITLPSGADAGTVTFEGKTIPATVANGVLDAYVGVDLDVKPGKHALGYESKVARGATDIVIAAKTFAVERLSVAKKYTELDPEAEQRVAREKKVLEALWSTISPQRLWTQPFARPTSGPLGSPFGLRRFFNGEARSPHAGLDLKAPPGAEVFASNAGRVALARDLFFTGNTVVIDHGMGLYTIYAHLARLDVTEGARAERSQRIGLVGATGRATGPHLHWGVRLAGARVDPATLPGLSL